MANHTREVDVRSLIATLDTLDVTLPTELANVIEAIDTVKALPAPEAVDVYSAARNGTLTKANAATLITTQATQPTNPGERHLQLKSNAVGGLLERFNTLLPGKTDDIIVALRPTFDTAADGVRAASEHITPDTTAEQVLAKGADAAAACVALDQHRRTLDRVHTIISALVTDFEVAGEPNPTIFRRRFAEYEALFYLAAGRRSYLPEAANFLLGPQNPAERGGRWHRFIFEASDLQLNTLTEVKAQITQITQDFHKNS